MTGTSVKICGLTTPEAVQAASDAEYNGFIFYEKSVRNISPDEAAKLKIHTKAKTVAVVVNPSDDFLNKIVTEFNPDYFQLHGDESPKRISEIKNKFKKPIIKAFNISASGDLDEVTTYQDSADMFLFDAKAPSGFPGGNGIVFDWKILAGKTFSKPWFISGGLNIENIAKALQISGATMLDISSGLESAPGVKNPQLIRKFIDKVRNI